MRGDDLDLRMLGALGAQRSMGQGATQRPDLSGRPVGGPRPASQQPLRDAFEKSRVLVEKLRAALKALLAENVALRAQVARLTSEVARLQAQIGQAQEAASAAWRGRAARGEPIPATVEEQPGDEPDGDGLTMDEVVGLHEGGEDDDGLGV